MEYVHRPGVGGWLEKKQAEHTLETIFEQWQVAGNRLPPYTTTCFHMTKVPYWGPIDLFFVKQVFARPRMNLQAQAIFFNLI